jgi:glycosyltransferase involved in cell wall biosynthesis
VSKEQIEQDEHMGYIKYRGFTNDMTNVYSEKGLVITLPTFYGEGMNRSLMEACACGKPIITTNIPGCKETVDDKQNGYLIPTHNSDALAEAMIRYIELSNEEKENYSKHSRKIALERFNIQTVISEYEKIINR